MSRVELRTTAKITKIVKLLYYLLIINATKALYSTV